MLDSGAADGWDVEITRLRYDNGRHRNLHRMERWIRGGNGLGRQGASRCPGSGEACRNVLNVKTAAHSCKSHMNSCLITGAEALSLGCKGIIEEIRGRQCE